MPAKSNITIVVMPDDSRLEVSYYFMNAKPKTKEKQAQLFIQLHDCICILEIEKTICSQPGRLEKIVHNKVINTKEHLC
jgi:hypothetical protein